MNVYLVVHLTRLRLLMAAWLKTIPADLPSSSGRDEYGPLLNKIYNYTNYAIITYVENSVLLIIIYI